MGLIFIILALLVGCYSLCAMLVLFAERVIRPRSPEPVSDGHLSGTDVLQQTELQ
jgi:hypothetical protein